MTDNVINSSIRVEEVLRNILKLNSNSPCCSNRRPTENETSFFAQQMVIIKHNKERPEIWFAITKVRYTEGSLYKENLHTMY